MNPILFALIAAQLLLVSWIDLRRKVISNYWHLLNLLSGTGLYVFLPEVYPLKWQVVLFPLGFLILGFLLFLAGIMGAGDSKYLASLSLMIPLDLQPHFLEMLLASTLLVAGILLAQKLVRDFRTIRAYAWTRYWQGLKNVVKSEFSYAPVILLAWVFLGVRQWV